MGNRTAKIIWDSIENFYVTPTEASVLLALAFFASDEFGHCHPLQSRLSEKTRLKLTAIKKAIGELERKGLIACSRKPAHVTEYDLLCVSDGTMTKTGSSGAPVNPSREQMPIVGTSPLEKKANLLLARSFAALLADPSQRLSASIDYGLLLDKCGFEAGFQWLFPLKKKLKGKPDDEIDAEILKHLAHPHRVDEGS